MSLHFNVAGTSTIFKPAKIDFLMISKCKSLSLDWRTSFLRDFFLNALTEHVDVYIFLLKDNLIKKFPIFEIISLTRGTLAILPFGWCADASVISAFLFISGDSNFFIWFTLYDKSASRHTMYSPLDFLKPFIMAAPLPRFSKWFIILKRMYQTDHDVMILTSCADTEMRKNWLKYEHLGLSPWIVRIYFIN